MTTPKNIVLADDTLKGVAGKKFSNGDYFWVFYNREWVVARLEVSGSPEKGVSMAWELPGKCGSIGFFDITEIGNTVENSNQN